MHVQQFGKFGASFGIVKGSCDRLARCFLDWQNEFLLEHAFRLTEAVVSGPIGEALQQLLPRTAPITTKYLFWPLNEEWTLYFDNGRLGTDAGPPSLLASRLGTGGMRISLSDQLREKGSSRILVDGGTIFEYFQNDETRRSIYAVNDGGRWYFGQIGTPFDFENQDAYAARLIRNRFTRPLVLQYLNELNASLDGTMASPLERGPGVLLIKCGAMPRDQQEFYE